MDDQLELVAKSYDRAIELGRKGVDLYKQLPEQIRKDPGYPIFEKMMLEGGTSDSARKEIKEYLSPRAGMNFVDLGCCLNLMFGGYDQWPSTYYGVDISSKTIELLREVVAKRNLPIGALHCGSIHETPFADDSFGIGACIGVLEYFEKDFVAKAITEAHRIIRPQGKFVVDVPDMGSPEQQITKRIEEHLGRPDRFDLSTLEFEGMLQSAFLIEKAEKVGPMIQYFLRCKK